EGRVGLMQMKLQIAGLLVLIFLAPATAAADEPLKSGIDRATFDLSVKPGDNFYEYVNGNWIKKNRIPPEYSRWGAFPKLRDDNLERLRLIIEDLGKAGAKLDADSQKVRDLYRTAMDEAKLDQQAAGPLTGTFERIAHIAT